MRRETGMDLRTRFCKLFLRGERVDRVNWFMAYTDYFRVGSSSKFIAC